MQPQTTVKFDSESFKRIKRTIENMSKTGRKREKNPKYATSIPHEIGIQLTRRCNLRCKHCFLWNEQGFFHSFEKEKQKTELDITIFEKLLRETREVKSNLYLWGTEPLLHKEWETIAKILEKEPRWTVLCTNGLLLEKRLESILRISSNLAIVVSLDGFQKEHEIIRGEGTFDSAIKNINLILSLQKTGEYKGKISLHCVLNKQITSKLFDLAEYCENLGIDTLYIGFPWYISKESAKNMDEYFKENFQWLNSLHPSDEQKRSWHFYTYHLDQFTTNILKEQFIKLNSREWKIRIRLQPALEPEEFENFLLGKENPAQKRRHCLSISSRMDIFPDGTVTSCQCFPEFNVGNLHEKGVIEIWQSEEFNKIREIINNNGLMPVCSKCILLYLYGR